MKPFQLRRNGRTVASFDTSAELEAAYDDAFDTSRPMALEKVFPPYPTSAEVERIRAIVATHPAVARAELACERTGSIAIHFHAGTVWNVGTIGGEWRADVYENEENATDCYHSVATVELSSLGIEPVKVAELICRHADLFLQEFLTAGEIVIFRPEWRDEGEELIPSAHVARENEDGGRLDVSPLPWGARDGAIWPRERVESRMLMRTGAKLK